MITTVKVLDETDKKILKLAGEGLTAKETGKVLFMSPRTVEKRLMKLREKHNCKKTIQLIEIIAGKKTF